MLICEKLTLFFMKQFYLLWSVLLLLPFSSFAQNYTAEELNEIEQAQFAAMMNTTIQTQTFGEISFMLYF